MSQEPVLEPRSITVLKNRGCVVDLHPFSDFEALCTLNALYVHLSGNPHFDLFLRLPWLQLSSIQFKSTKRTANSSDSMRPRAETVSTVLCRFTDSTSIGAVPGR
ncbi:hypothetical protein KC363_g6 [Hortaea werneckii]|nr:hypothetical protein KC363_g6 [Hortaea werneckii]